MRVLFVTNFVPHYRRGVLEGLAQLHDLVVVADDHDHVQGVPPDEGSLQVVRRRGWRVFGPVVLMPGVLWPVMTSRYDILLLWGNAFWPHVWLATMIARLRRRRVVHWGHGWTGKEGSFLGLARSLLYRMADRLLLFGHRAAELGVQKFRYPAERAVVVGNSLPGPVAARRLARSPRGDAHDQILLVARLTPERRIHLLVEAVELLRRQGREVRCVVVGDGPDLSEARRLARDLGVGELVNFVGSCYDDEELAAHYSRSSIVAIPGKAGLTVAQAYALGCPVVCSDDDSEHAPESEAVVDGVTGWRFEARDAGSLASTIARALEPGPWERIAASASLAFDQQFTVAGHVARVSAALEEVVGGR